MKFVDVEVGDTVVVFDEYSHDYVEHEIKVTSIEYDKENITDTNPNGKVCYGEDLTYDDDEHMITVVTESNFTR